MVFLVFISKGRSPGAKVQVRFASRFGYSCSCFLRSVSMPFRVMERARKRTRERSPPKISRGDQAVIELRTNTLRIRSVAILAQDSSKMHPIGSRATARSRSRRARGRRTQQGAQATAARGRSPRSTGHRGPRTLTAEHRTQGAQATAAGGRSPRSTGHRGPRTLTAEHRTQGAQATAAR